MLARRVATLTVVAAVATVACAPRQAIVVEPSLTAGAIARYRFDADVRTALEQGSVRAVASTLQGTLEIEVVEILDAATRLRIRVEPSASTRDGEATNPGPPQERIVLMLANGAIASDPGDASTLGEADLDPDALATLLRPRVPSSELRPGARWEVDGTQGRLVSLARDAGRDLARLDLRRSSEVARSRVLDGRPIQLSGVERAHTDLWWSLDDGLPWSASIRSTATLTVRAGAQLGGTITIEARTRIEAIE